MDSLEQKREFWSNQSANVDSGKIESIDVVPQAEPSTKAPEVQDTGVNNPKAESKSEDFLAEKKPEVIKQEKAPEKIEKETIRRDKSWQALETEKVQVRAKETEYQTKLSELQQAKATFDAQVQKAIQDAQRQVREEYKKKRPDIVEAKPEWYEQQALKAEQDALTLDEQGESQQALRKRQEAYQYRTYATQLKGQLQEYLNEESESSRRQESYLQEAKNHDAKIWKDIIEKEPEFLDDKHPKAIKFNNLMNDPQLKNFLDIKNNPNGRWYASQMATALYKADLYSALEKENAELKEQTKSLNKKLTPGSGTETGKLDEKQVSSMSRTEKGDFFKRQAELADSYNR